MRRAAQLADAGAACLPCVCVSPQLGPAPLGPAASVRCRPLPVAGARRRGSSSRGVGRAGRCAPEAAAAALALGGGRPARGCGGGGAARGGAGGMLGVAGHHGRIRGRPAWRRRRRAAEGRRWRSAAMVSPAARLVGQGVWAALTGGWYHDPEQGAFTNSCHLYLWLFLLTLPMALHLVRAGPRRGAGRWSWGRGVGRPPRNPGGGGRVKKWAWWGLCPKVWGGGI